MSAGDRFFVDTNVLLYSVDASSPVKRQAARIWLGVLWENGIGALSWQVLHEFYVNVVRKVRVSKPLARQFAEDFAQWRPPEMTIGLIRRAWHWTDRAQLSYWDSLILAAAERIEVHLASERRFSNRSQVRRSHYHQSVLAHAGRIWAHLA